MRSVDGGRGAGDMFYSTQTYVYIYIYIFQLFVLFMVISKHVYLLICLTNSVGPLLSRGALEPEVGELQQCTPGSSMVVQCTPASLAAAALTATGIGVRAVRDRERGLSS